MILDQYSEDSQELGQQTWGPVAEVNANVTENKSLSDLFLALTKQLQRNFDISRGLLVVREQRSTRFLAVSTWSDRKTRKNLSLRIPNTSSLFDKVAEQGQLFSENFADLFSGNSFERNLLLAPDAQAYVLQPLKHEGVVVGLIGYSSDSPMAFATFEEGILDEVSTKLARMIATSETLNRPA